MSAFFLYTIPTKYLSEKTRFLRSQGDCYDAWKFVERHCANEISQIQGINFDHSYSPVARADSFIINITIVAIHRITAIIVHVSNAFQNTHVPIHVRLSFSPPSYDLDWFERSCPNVPLN